MTASGNKLAALPVQSESPAPSWEIRRRDRSLPHLRRKLYHLVSGLLCIAMYAFVLTREQALIILGTLGGTLVTLDVLRLRLPGLNRFGLAVFGKLMRREELRSLTGNSFYILGLIVIVFFFPKPVVLLSTLFLAVGDPIAAIVGSHYGKTKIWKGKSLEGALANYCASAMGTLILSYACLGITGWQSARLALIGGLISVIAELIPLPIDDNFSIPVISATALMMLAPYLGLL